jgi:uncharacterized protein
MPASLFFARLVPNRPDFAMSMTADEQAAMRAHGEFLQGQFERDPARAVGRYEISPMGPSIVRPARPAGS